MSTAVAGKGLEGVVAANSGICWIDGDAGVLSYRGIDIHELAVHSTFEETTYLLWNGILPNELALREFQSQLQLARGLDFRIVDMLRGIPASATPMEVLRTAVSALSFYDADEKDNSPNRCARALCDAKGGDADRTISFPMRLLADVGTVTEERRQCLQSC